MVLQTVIVGKEIDIISIDELINNNRYKIIYIYKNNININTYVVTYIHEIIIYDSKLKVVNILI